MAPALVCQAHVEVAHDVAEAAIKSQQEVAERAPRMDLNYTMTLYLY